MSVVIARQPARDVANSSRTLTEGTQLITAHITRVIPFFALVSKFQSGLTSVPIKVLFRIPNARQAPSPAALPPQATSPQPVPFEPNFVVPAPAPAVSEATFIVAVSPPAPTALSAGAPSIKPKSPPESVIPEVPPEKLASSGPMHSLVPLPPTPDVPPDESLSDLFAPFSTSVQAASLPADSFPIAATTVGMLFGDHPSERPQTFAMNAPTSQTGAQTDDLSPLFKEGQAPDGMPPSEAV